jgi:hypothetical protein
MTHFAPSCRCERPLRDGETCLRCGRVVDPLAQLQLTPPARRRQEKQAWTRAGVVRAIRAFAFFRGRAPTPADWRGRTGQEWPPLASVEELFGSVAAAVQAAGVEGRSPPWDAVGA